MTPTSKRPVPKPSKTYWWLQSLGWLLYGTIGYATNTGFNQGVPPLKVAALAYSGAAMLLLLTHALRRHAHRRGWTQLGFGKLILRLLLATFILSAFSQCILSLLMFWPFAIISDSQPYSFLFLLIYVFQTQIILLLWSLAYFSYHAIRNYKSEEVERWRLQATAKDAELIALKAQINPHFIFNCLNNIRALVLEDPEKARDAITRLSDLLRSSIQFNKAETVTLASELEIVRDYLALESIHMEDRLRYSITADPNAEDCLLPPMAIQLLAENAIKHSLALRPDGGRISVDARLDEANLTLCIQVLNTGQLADPTKKRPTHASTGTGLRNLQDRLQLLFGPSAALELRNHDADHVSATLTLYQARGS